MQMGRELQGQQQNNEHGHENGAKISELRANGQNDRAKKVIEGARGCWCSPCYLMIACKRERPTPATNNKQQTKGATPSDKMPTNGSWFAKTETATNE